MNKHAKFLYRYAVFLFLAYLIVNILSTSFTTSEETDYSSTWSLLVYSISSFYPGFLFCLKLTLKYWGAPDNIFGMEFTPYNPRLTAMLAASIPVGMIVAIPMFFYHAAAFIVSLMQARLRRNTLQ